MISPVIYFNVVMGIIGGFQAFAQALIMTDASGAPQQSTLFYVLNLYNVGFQDLRMGYASAMAWVLFIIILALTYCATRLSQALGHLRLVDRERWQVPIPSSARLASFTCRCSLWRCCSWCRCCGCSPPRSNRASR